MLYKPNIPVIPLDQRIEMLKALSCVDIVIPYHELDYLTVCKEVKADIFVIGEDWGEKLFKFNIIQEHHPLKSGRLLFRYRIRVKEINFL